MHVSLVIAITLLPLLCAASGIAAVLSPASRVSRGEVYVPVNRPVVISAGHNRHQPTQEKSRAPVDDQGQPKTFFIVAAPESSGNRYTVSLLQATGCFGRAGHMQPFDVRHDWNGINPAGFYGASMSAQCYVMHRSIPHAGTWPDLRTISRNVRAREMNPVLITIHRNESIVAQSQVHEHHVRDLAQARLNIARAQRSLHEQHEWARQNGVQVVELEFSRMGDADYMQSEFYTKIGRPQPRNSELTRFKNPDARYK